MKAVSADPRSDFIRYPTNRVVGTVADASKAAAAVDALLRAGFDRQDIDVLHDEADLQRLGPTSDHGFLAQFQRTLNRFFDFEEFKHLTHHIEDVRAGRFVIMVLTKRRGLRILAADILHQHGAEFVGFYGRWAWEELPSTAQTSPEDIPALFVRAWNNRDANALAVLFDEDAEFVTGTGMCWHDRASIRRAHADGLKGLFNTTTLALGAVRVKRLSPEVAVVLAHMTCAAVDPSRDATPSGPRTMIVSFVVHRTTDRWLCASAHTTHMTSDTAPGVIDDAGVFGVASYPGDQVSG